jgi:hypothetical protein
LAFPSLARESLVLRPEGRLNLTTVTGVAHTHRLAVRRPGPSARLAGAPTRISRSSRVSPSGQLSTLGAHEAAVKATFPLARRVCPASDGSNYFDGISGDAPSLRQARRGAHWFSGTATGGHGARSWPGSGCAATSSRPPDARKDAAQPAPLAPAPGGRQGPPRPGQPPAAGGLARARFSGDELVLWQVLHTSPRSWPSIRYTGSDPWLPGGRGRFRTSGLCRVNPGRPPHQTWRYPTPRYIPAGKRRCQA